MIKKRVIFIGGLTNGMIVYKYLVTNPDIDLILTITYKDNSLKPRNVNFPNDTNIIKSGSIKNHKNIIKNLKPDIIFVTGWSELISDDILSIPKMGVIGFHPSKLPYDKGRSVVAWQILEGYKESALTMFYYNNIPDGGDIIAQEKIKISKNDYVNDVLQKIDIATESLIKKNFPLIIKGKNHRIKQDPNEGNFRRLRKDNDSQIDWNTNSIDIYNLIRAISYPYPCAVGRIDKKDYKIIKAEIFDFNSELEFKPGDIVELMSDTSIIIKTKDSYIRLLEYERK